MQIWTFLHHTRFLPLRSVDLFISVPYGDWNIIHKHSFSQVRLSFLTAPSFALMDHPLPLVLRLENNCERTVYEPMNQNYYQHLNIATWRLSWISPSAPLHVASLPGAPTSQIFADSLKVSNTICWQTRFVILGIQVWCHSARPWTVGAWRQHRGEI